MHLLAVNEEGFAHFGIEMFPEGVGVVADVAGDVSSGRLEAGRIYVLDGHETDTGEDCHDGEELPKIQAAEELQTSNIYTVRAVVINN